MNTLEIIFFILLSIVFYTYIGYGIILWILVRIKRIFVFITIEQPKLIRNIRV